MKSLLAFLAITSLVSPVLAGEALSLPDLDGKPVAALDAAGKKAAVIFFVSPYCPTSNTFAPEMNSIVKDFGGDFVFRFVHSDTTVTEADRKQHATMMEFTEPVLTDIAQKLAKQLGAKTTPEVVVVTPDGKTVYQGRINDLYLGPTKRQREIKTHDLRDALTALRDGKPVANPRTEAMGCGIVIAP
jgi:thiol-disulfide isomerase/thioredoxin